MLLLAFLALCYVCFTVYILRLLALNNVAEGSEDGRHYR
jgi:hypothetical protein